MSPIFSFPRLCCDKQTMSKYIATSCWLHRLSCLFFAWDSVRHYAYIRHNIVPEQYVAAMLYDKLSNLGSTREFYAYRRTLTSG